jgi:hypothetical protein
MQGTRSLASLLAQGLLLALVLRLSVGLPPGAAHTAGPVPTPAVDIRTRLKADHRTGPGSSPRDGRVLVEAPPPPGSGTEGPSVAPEAHQTFDANADADVLQGYPDTNFEDALEMWAGYDDYLEPDGQIARSLVGFDIASLPPGMEITTATLRLRLVRSWDYPDTSRTITTCRVTDNWSESLVTWNNRPGFGEAYGSTSILNDALGWHEFDVTGLVDAWYNGTHPNYGIMVRGPEVSGIQSSWRAFGTQESVYTPTLVVEYSEMTNTAPTLSGLPDKHLPLNGSLDSAIDLWAHADDAEDNDADLIFTIVNTPAAGAGVSLDSNRYVDIFPASGWSGTTDVEIEVRDTGGLTDADTFRVTVLSDQHPIYLPLVQRPSFVASKVIHTSEEGTVVHPGGARIYVPHGAVPSNLQGGEGEMLFTIERGKPDDFGVPSTPPTGWEMLTDIFGMGPEGFIFNTPIEASIRLPDDYDRTTQVVSMFDYDFEEEEWESVGGRVTDDGFLTADSLHLCANVGMARAVSGKGPGAIEFQGIPGYSFKLCIEEYTLKYPDWDSDFEVRNRFRSIIRGDSPNAPPDGKQYWILPQGTYKISVMVYYHDVDDRPPTYLGYFQRTITIDRPHWDWEMGGPDFEFAVPFGPFVTNPRDLLPDRPPCAGTPTPSIGVGAVNVRLEWWADADLDLWVVDPCGNRIYYGDRQKTCDRSVGELDLDNLCGSGYVGQPENIYWAQNPPRGLYKVYVDYFQDCASVGSVQYTVRWWVNGTTHVRRGIITPPASTGASGDEILVTQFMR